MLESCSATCVVDQPDFEGYVTYVVVFLHHLSVSTVEGLGHIKQLVEQDVSSRSLSPIMLACLTVPIVALAVIVHSNPLDKNLAYHSPFVDRPHVHTNPPS